MQQQTWLDVHHPTRGQGASEVRYHRPPGELAKVQQVAHVERGFDYGDSRYWDLLQEARTFPETPGICRGWPPPVGEGSEEAGSTLPFLRCQLCRREEIQVCEGAEIGGKCRRVVEVSARGEHLQKLRRPAEPRAPESHRPLPVTSASRSSDLATSSTSCSGP